MREEFDDLESALKFVQENYESENDFSFKLEKTGVQYQTEMATIWLEDIVDLGVSVEIVSEYPKTIDQIIQQLNIIKKLGVSVPKYMYQSIVNRKR